MDASLNRKGRRGGPPRDKGWIIYFSLPIMLALLLLGGWLFLPGMRGALVARAAGTGGSSGVFTFTLTSDFNQNCALITNTTVTSVNPDGEVRLRASLEDYFDGVAIDTNLWITGTVFTWYESALPMVSGGLLTLDANLIRSQTLFNLSPRFVEARAKVRANSNNAANIDIGYYRNDPPSPPSPTPPITADTAVRLFLVENGGSNNLLARLVDGTQSPPTDEDIANPDLTQWLLFRIEWGETNTDYYVDGVLQTSITETIPGGDDLYARILLYHMDPTGIYNTAPMQVDWIRGGQYPSSGTYTSCSYEAGGVVNFSNVSWDADVPSGAGLTIQARTSLDNVTWSDWSNPIDASQGSSSGLTVPSGRYLQYRLNFTSSSLIRTAEMRSIQFNYYGPTRLDVSPDWVTLDPNATQLFSAAAYDANNREVSGVTVNWSSIAGSINASGLFTAPLFAGTYSGAVNATILVAKTPTLTLTLTDTADVTVADLPPTANAGGPYSGDEGASIALTGSGSDPNGGSVSFSWDLDNNGSFETNGQNVNNIWNDNGNYTIRLRVTDSTNQSSTITATVNVNNVAPTASFSAPASVDEGSKISLSLSGASDPSSVDAEAGFQYAFDCGSGYGDFSSSASANCSTADSGSLTVRGRIRDKDGGETEYTAGVVVNNVAPKITSVTNNGPVYVNQAVQIQVNVSASIGDVLTYEFDCNNDGTYEVGPQSESLAICTFTQSGTYTIKVKVSDDDGTWDSGTTDVVVENYLIFLPLVDKQP